MQNNKFKTPLLQSAAILVIVVVLVVSAGSSDSGASAGGIVTLLSGIGNTILFVIGMAIALTLSIALLIGIFLAAVAMVDSDQASQMYSGLKKNFSLNAARLSGQCCNQNLVEPSISEEEYQHMKQTISALQDSNSALLTKIRQLTGDNESLQSGLQSVRSENSQRLEQIEQLNEVVATLKESEQKTKDLVAELTAKVEKISISQEVKDQLDKLKLLQEQTRGEIDTILQRINSLEDSAKSGSSEGIFAYIEKDEDKKIFAEKIEEAVILEMTYAQIDEHLTESLSPELDKIVKDHPTLTKTYIRSVRELSAD
ncbi:hypothetical protein [Desulforhopalus singaporensis]|uniref:Uncharacterized protein n=1 Tax=Desulforhopalus singaporensis TaxID=91360 RepID=A0A1H0V4P6_9BACT|nr:hypothetical protein [Desulforhopalus singaporensis]SDP73351.1 hypothetical protein SAMN05660330_03867 [Desulforhopalus singaporensis]